MRNLIYILTLTLSMLCYGHTLQSQCDSLFEATVSETFTEMDGEITGEFAIFFRQTVEGVSNSANVLITGDPGVTLEDSGESVSEIRSSTAFNGSTRGTVSFQYSCPDGMFPLEGLNVYVRFALGGCDTLTITLPLATESSCSDSGGVSSTGDERQVGNTIEDLGDGRVSALNGDGTVIAFSSAGGYYICELIGDVWTPIGGEITTEVPVAEIFVSADGNSVFVNLSEGFTPQCSYRNGEGFDTNTLADPNRESRVTRIWDVTADGSYILFQTAFSEDGDITIGSSCGTLGSGGSIETQLNVNVTTGIAGGTVTRGYLSDDGQSFCVADGELNRTALYTVEGNEISTFDGQVVSASGDLTNCLIATSTSMGYIGVWDGGTTFTSSEPFDITATAAYNFGSRGGTCVGLTTNGQIYITTITTEGGEVMVTSEFFIIDQVSSFRSINVNGGANRFSGSGGSGGENPDLFVFEFSTSMMPGDDTDTDMDGVPDIDDQDDDNDGILDSEECLSATDYSETEFGPSQITILTSRGDVVNISVGSMVTDDALFGIGFPNSFNLDRGADNTNRFVMNFPFEIYSLSITAIDFDSDAFGDPTEWMDDFSIFPTRVSGDGRSVEEGFTFGTQNQQTLVGQGVIPDTINGVMELFWDNLPAGTTSLSWNNRRTTMDLDINFQIDGICIDTDGDRIPNEKDPDSDGDGCPDVEEAGHADADGDEVLGNSPITVDENGLVTGQDGYTGITDDVIVVNEGCEVVEECDEFSITAGSDSFITCPEEAITIIAADLLSNDNASNGAILEIQELRLDNAADGTLVDNEDGTWSFTPSPDFNADISLSYVVKREDASLFFEDNGHFYEFVPGQDISWEEARDAAAARTKDGLQGYLATITTQAENDFIQTKLAGRGWLGGLEVGGVTTGEWRWVTGPEGLSDNEQGLQFWDGNIGGNPIPDVFQNWRDGEPNNSTGAGNTEGGEQYLHIRFDIAPGKWNDYPSRGFPNLAAERIEGYIVEFGGLEECETEFITTGVVTISLNEECPSGEECEACPGDVTPPVITCPEDITVTATEFENQTNNESIFNGFESEYEQADITLGDQALVPEGLWAVTSDPSQLHFLFSDCDDADGNPDGEMLVFNGAPETNIAVYCQNVDVVADITYDMSVMVASVLTGSPARIQFAVDDVPQGDIHAATDILCDWTELSTPWTATASGSVRFCILNQNDAAGGNDFALDNFSITAEDGTEIKIGVDTGVATATDDCAEITPTFVDSEVVGECETIITRTWTAVDPCGNESSCIQTITVTNDEDTGACAQCDTFAIEIGVVTAISGTNPTGEVFGTNTYGIISNNGTGPFSYQWNDGSTGETLDLNYSYNPTLGETNPLNGTVVSLTVVDANGCTTASTVTIDFGGGDECDCTDTTPPVIEGVEVFVVGECGELSLEALGISATDNCGDVTITFEDFNFSPSCLGSLQRTYTATDVCGNTTEVIQIIELTNENGPIIECPENASYACIEDVPAAIDPVVSHGCGLEVTIELDESTVVEGCATIITRVWTATDECGGVSTCIQVIRVEDTDAPIPPAAPGDLMIQCAQEVPAAAELTAEDNCGTIEGVLQENVNPGDCPNSFVVTRTWTFTDECGNASSVSQTITVEDTEAPSAPGAPAPLAVQCADDVPTAAELVGQDNCSGTITGEPSDEVTPGDCPNSFVVTRTWTFTDECGNSSTVSQMITVADTQAPVAPASPPALIVQCADDVPVAAELVGQDNCSGAIIGEVADEVTPGDCPNSFVITRIWTFTDECGNASTTRQEIAVNDTEAPVPPTAPAALTVQCPDDIPVAAELVAQDNCSGAIIGEVEEVITQGDCPSSFVLFRRWTFTDECGNTSGASQTITVADTQAPVAPEAPAPLAVQCADDVPAAAELTAQDNCSGTITGEPSDVVTPGDCPNSFVVTRTWTFTDECGNTSSVSQTITVEDTEAPSAPAAPTPLAVQCADDVPAAAELVAQDNCSGTITGDPSDVVTPGDCPNSFVVTRTWTFTDECGNTSSVSQTITVEDTEAPSAPAAPAPLAVQCADDVPPAAELVAQDNCSGTITGDPSDVVTPGDCPNSFVVTRTWTFTDECGNTSSVSQTITVEDTEAPSAPAAPAPLAVQCADDVPAAAELTAQDNCSGTITGAPSDVVTPGDCPNSFVVTRTWTFTDECGNASSISQTITIEDTEAPSAPAAPAPLAVQCADDVPAAAELVAQDNCSGTITGAPSDVVTPGDCPNSFVVTRTWTFTDECGNASSVSQTITVEDTEAPVAPEAPAPLAVQCADDVPAAAELVAQDNCSGTITGAPSDVVTPGDCPNSFVVTRTWAFTDECGNTSSVSQTITVEDTEAPSAPAAPAPLAVQCADDVPAAAELVAQDNCSGTIAGDPSDVVTPGDCPNSFVVTRTWIFTDECGNTSSVSQTITVEDTEAPSAPAAPAPLAVQCADDVPAAAELVAQDNCSGTITGAPSDVVTPGDCPNSFVVTRTWAFTDECGNTSSVSQTITVEDTEAPSAPAAPTPLAVQCADDVPAAAELVAQDNCSGTITGDPSDVVTPGDCPNSFVVTRTWIFTDECGNTSSVSQTITVEDTEAPSAPAAPAPLAVQCADDVPAAAELVAQDNCSGTITGESSDVVTPGDCPNSFVVTRTWTFTDECGNASSVSQTITVEDTEAPVAPEAPAPLAVQCADDVPAAAELVAQDNCSGTITGAPSDVVTPGDCPNSFVVTRTWTFTDECGNTSSVSQTITVEDTEAPSVPGAPAPLAVQCADDVPAAAELVAQDNCSGTITGAPSDVVTPGDCPNSFVVTRTWTFTDECGNTSSVSQTITVEDTEAPVAPEAPGPVTVQCADDVPTTAELSAQDNCSGTITGEATDVVTEGDCPNSFVITRTWTFTDECGNASTVSQTITVADTEAPVPPEAPAPLTVQCADDIPAAATLSAFDNCNGFISGVSSDEVTPGDCPNSFVVTRTWTFTDECGNASSISQTITVADTQAPALPAVPAAMTVQCADDVPQAEELVAQDNCSGSITGEVSEVRTPGDCPNSLTVTRTWTFTDECGNASSASQTITVADTEAPTFVETPANRTVQCIDDVGAITVPAAVDNCQEPAVSCEAVEDLDECQNGIITVTCTAVDSCGNVSTTSYTITINDTTPPELVGVPENITLDCDADLPEVPDVQGIDNCDNDVTIDFTEIINGGQPIECELSQPAEPVCHDTENWAMRLFDTPEGEFFSNVSTTFSEFDDGTARITGTVSDNNDPNSGYAIDARFEGRMNWEEWSNQSFPTSFKDECGTGNNESWTYYVFAEGSTIAGFGRYQGTVLTLTHAPQNLFFAYQVGLGANNVNASEGNGGWFFAEGELFVDGVSSGNVRSAGDFAFDGDCCTSYEVERTWTATDCSGNTSETGTQIITFEGTSNFSDDSRQAQIEDDVIRTPADSYKSTVEGFAITKLAPNPTSDQALLSYILNKPMDVQIDIVDLTGRSVQTFSKKNVTPGVEYNHIISTENMLSGVYFIRINSGKELILEKLVVAKE